MARVASRQFGRITYAQLLFIVSSATIHKWVASGYLIPVLPRVYAVGHRADSQEADLFGAVLYAGPGAALSHRTAAWWRQLIDYPPAQIVVSSPRHTRSREGIEVHGRRRRARVSHRGIPVTPVAQTMLDLASDAQLPLVLMALGRLDFRRELDAQALLEICGPGRPGGARLKEAVLNDDPRWAKTNGPLELDFLAFCRKHGIPLPEIGEWRYGIQLDAYWPEHRLVVQLDGEGNHGPWTKSRQDHADDLILRRHGLTVLRYDWEQVHGNAEVRDDILAHLQARAA